MTVVDRIDNIKMNKYLYFSSSIELKSLAIQFARNKIMDYCLIS